MHVDISTYRVSLKEMIKKRDDLGFFDYRLPRMGSLQDDQAAARGIQEEASRGEGSLQGGWDRPRSGLHERRLPNLWRGLTAVSNDTS